DLQRATRLEAARRGDQGWIRNTVRPSEPLEPAHKVEILHQRYGAKSADRFIDPATNENPGVTVIHPDRPYPHADPGEPSAEGCVAIENEPKIATDDLRFSREHLVNLVQRSWQQSTISVKEQQHLAVRGPCACRERNTPTRRSQEYSDFMIARDFQGS